MAIAAGKHDVAAPYTGLEETRQASLIGATKRLRGAAAARANNTRPISRWSMRIVAPCEPNGPAAGMPWCKMTDTRLDTAVRHHRGDSA